MQYTLLLRLLDLAVGIFTVLAIRWRWKDRKDISFKDLIREIEKRDREIERLKIAKHVAELRHEHLANKTQHLQKH